MYLGFVFGKGFVFEKDIHAIIFRYSGTKTEN